MDQNLNQSIKTLIHVDRPQRDLSIEQTYFSQPAVGCERR